ncbi:hypothetical protein E4656_04055 [Natronospirillum operosum]|uniref:Uncharacterized protein n=1 Tax=Natronospirillum operosum TaxID=2759953 RepID=A0A4Z0WCM8_9GAMM|nr:hypothetical protein [Natronospirillum operosum]TGG95594.1 hypothetical protein E4656_04055 [Natronospirillum operosum]
MSTSECNDMLPPWLQYPDIPLGSMGWRMGPGEEYWYQFVAWLGELSAAEREAYKRRHPRPESWAVFWPYVPEQLAAFFDTEA